MFGMTKRSSWDFSTTKCFQMIYLICTSLYRLQCFAMTVSASRSYCRYQSLPHSPPQQNIRQLFFSFRKVWGYPTSLIWWFINFKKLSISNSILITTRSLKLSKKLLSQLSLPTNNNRDTGFAWWGKHNEHKTLKLSFCRSSRRRSSIKKVFQNSQENVYARVSFLIKLQADLLKKSLWHRYFSVNFAKSLSAHFLKNLFGGCFFLLFMKELLNASFDNSEMY